MKERDAWISKPQPTPELCRLFHGIDCRRCVGEFGLLDKLVTYEAFGRADQWRRDFDERKQLRAELERKHAAWVEMMRGER